MLASPHAFEPWLIRRAAPRLEATLQVAGSLRIVDDCTLLLEDFSFDGAAPAVHIWGAPSLDSRDIQEQGRRISPLHLDRAYSNETVRNAEILVPAVICACASCMAARLRGF